VFDKACEMGLVEAAWELLQERAKPQLAEPRFRQDLTARHRATSKVHSRRRHGEEIGDAEVQNVCAGPLGLEKPPRV
jgi:hypothetical protein